MTQKEDMVYPITSAYITRDMADNLALSLKGLGEVSVYGPMAKDEVSYVIVDAPNKRIKEVIDGINNTLQDGGSLRLRSRM